MSSRIDRARSRRAATARLIVPAVLALSGCSGVSLVCSSDGVCQETWRNEGVFSTALYSRLKNSDGSVVAGSATSAFQSGVMSYFDPLASGLQTSAADVKAFRE